MDADGPPDPADLDLARLEELVRLGPADTEFGADLRWLEEKRLAFEFCRTILHLGFGCRTNEKGPRRRMPWEALVLVRTWVLGRGGAVWSVRLGGWPGLRKVLVLLLHREGEALNLVPMDADRAPDPAGPEFVGAQELEELRPADPEFFADFGNLQEKGTSRSGFRLVHGDWLPANKKAPVGFEPKRAFCLGGLGSVGGKASLGRRHSCRCQTARGK